MGFLDSVQAGINRGADSAQRTARSTKLKMDQNDLMKQRKELAAQLGASLYDATKDDEGLRAGREPLFDGIAAIDAKRAEIQAELDSLEAAAVASAQAAQVYRCPGCGSSVSATDLFCSGCGKPIAEVKAAVAPAPAPADGPVCANCGAALVAGDAFCMSCGAAVGAAPAEPVVESALVPEPEPEPQSDFSASSSDETSEDAPVSEAKICPACGEDVATDDVFCGACGASLS